MGFLQLSIVVIIPIWMFSTSVFLLFVRLIFVFVLFSFLIFVFGKMYLMYTFIIFPFLFYQLRVNDKTEIERKNRLFIFAFQRMRIPIGERTRKKKKKGFFFFLIFYQG